MSIKIAINGFGRIGRNVLRALYENGYRDRIQLVAINDLCPAETIVHLLRQDSTHGPFQGEVELNGGNMIVNGDSIGILSERAPGALPWRQMQVDVVLECTGLFIDAAGAGEHIKAGAKKVLISAPGKNVDATVVYGVNHNCLKAEHKIVSNASCTTNCLAPMAMVLHQQIGIVHGFMTTVHSYTSDQSILDAPHRDLRRARAAALSMIPTSTGAARAVGEVLPDLRGLLDGYAVRVPTPNVSLTDLTVRTSRETSSEEINQLMRQAEAGELQGILRCSEQELVSVDYNHSPESCILDCSLTKVIDGTMVKLVAWYDNEWGFSNRMLDVSSLMAQK
ncbi:MAG: type I glyceraldehyde-3-phosphate dehydrogenase [Candidatus Porifericomitaceae bacterium WSBS_2022_MAG_OTU9]